MENHLKPKQKKTAEDKGDKHISYIQRVINLVAVINVDFMVSVFYRQRHEQLMKATVDEQRKDEDRNKMLSRSVEMNYDDVVECVKVFIMLHIV